MPQYQYRNIDYGQRLPEAIVDAVQQFLGQMASANFLLTKLNDTTLQVVAANNANDQVSIGIMAKFRWIQATITAAHPGGSAGTYDVFVTAFNNVFTPTGGSPPETDDTNYAFFLQILASGATPSGTVGTNRELYRKVGTCVWDGAKIVAVSQLVGGGPVAKGLGAGVIYDFEGPEANIPPDACVADGRYLDNVTEAEHFLRVGTTWNTFGGLPAPPAGKHRVVDMRGRGTVGKGDMGSGNPSTPTATGARIQRSGINTLGTLMGEEYHVLITAEIPSHQHGGSTGAEAAHTHSGTTGAGSSHSHGATGLTFTGSGGTTGGGTAHSHGATGLTFTGSSATSGGDSISHWHIGTTDGESASHTHSQDGVTVGAMNPGGGGSIANIPAAGAPQYWPVDPMSFSNNTTDHTHTFTSGGISNAHTHNVTATGTIGGSTATESAHTHGFTPAGTIGGTTAAESAHTHPFTTGAGTSHVHSISAEGGGGSHENVPPVAVVVKFVSLR